MHTAALSQSPALSLLPGRRPALRVVEGGRAPPELARRAAYRRRRLVALVLVVLAAVAVSLLVGAISTGLASGGHPSSAAGASSPAAIEIATAPVASAAVIVQPGDTLWSIASRIAPEADVRATVARLVELNGRAPLAVGQHLRLP